MGAEALKLKWNTLVDVALFSRLLTSQFIGMLAVVT